MYIAVRADLPAGLQVAQAVHAAFEFSVAHSQTVNEWARDSNYLIIVQVPDEQSLLALHDTATARGIALTLVREPDIGDEATALALEPGDAARRLCSSLPLALREPRMVA